MPHILKIDTKIKVEHRIIMHRVRAHPKEARIVCPGNLCGKFLSAGLSFILVHWQISSLFQARRASISKLGTLGHKYIIICVGACNEVSPSFPCGR